jgi:hypothetical protein
MDVPAVISLVVTATAIGMAVALALILDRAPGLGARSHQRRTAVATGLTLIAWVLAASLLAVGGAFRTPVTPPTVAYPLVGFVLLGLLAVRGVAPLRQLVEQPWVQSRLVSLHAWRFAGGIFLIMAALGDVPWLFALPAGLGDVAVAIMAPAVARRLRRGTGRSHALAWNVFGMLDLVVAVGLGVTTSAGAAQIFTTSPSSELLSGFPLVLFPAFLVPVSFLTHVLSLRFLLREPTRRTAVGAVTTG